MEVTVIKKYTKHNRVFNIGDVLGVTKDKAKGLINLGLVKDTNNTLGLAKKVEVKKTEPKKEAFKPSKKSKK